MDQFGSNDKRDIMGLVFVLTPQMFCLAGDLGNNVFRVRGCNRFGRMRCIGVQCSHMQIYSLDLELCVTDLVKSHPYHDVVLFNK